MASSKSDFIVQIESARSPDGLITQLQFIRADGRTSYIDIPTLRVKSFLASLQNALAGRPSDELPAPCPLAEVGRVVDVARVDAAIEEGQPRLKLTLASGEGLGLNLDSERVSDAIDALLALSRKLPHLPR